MDASRPPRTGQVVAGISDALEPVSPWSSLSRLSTMSTMLANGHLTSSRLGIACIIAYPRQYFCDQGLGCVAVGHWVKSDKWSKTA